ncbi:MAG TPA: pseudouridine synthase, partial [Anaerolineae bacterium]
PARVKVEAAESSTETWLSIVLHEGKKRQIKRVAKTLGHPVIRLARIRIGNILLGNLKPGEWRHLTANEVNEINKTTAGTVES